MACVLPMCPISALAALPEDAAQASPSPVTQSHFVQAEGERAPGADLVAAIDQLLANVRETRYQHQSRIDPGNGIYELDCSEFVSLVLERVAPARGFCFLSRTIPKGSPVLMFRRTRCENRPYERVTWR
jgi:hypothetical protein